MNEGISKNLQLNTDNNRTDNTARSDIEHRIETDATAQFSWRAVAWHSLVSRALDEIEETKLFPSRKILMQFSAKGHEVSQAILGSHLTHNCDGVSVYYRSRPLMLSLGMTPGQALAGSLALNASISSGRDGGMVFHREGLCRRPTVLPMCGDVGAQFTQSAGWAQAALYRATRLKDSRFKGAIAVAHGGDGSTATGGFWSALNIATTLKLPMLFFIEDNGYAISTPTWQQTPGGDIADNLSAFKNLTVYNGDGTNPSWLRENIFLAISEIRNGRGPALIRATVPRIRGHSIQDSQSYKSVASMQYEQASDPLPRLKNFILPNLMCAEDWHDLEQHAADVVDQSLQELISLPQATTDNAKQFVFYDDDKGLQQQGGVAPERYCIKLKAADKALNATRINMSAAIRRTLESELMRNERLLVYGQDVGIKGGIHGVTQSLRDSFGEHQVFDTSLSEEGIMGRAVGLAICGLLPCPEIQFRKYADAAMEQIRNIGTIRWRTANTFAAPMVLRMTVGSAGREDHWHNMCDESIWAHMIGWRIIFPSNANDAVGLLRTALRSNDPIMFLEHRALLDGYSARRAYPGDDYMLPLGQAEYVCEGTDVTVISWGAMVDVCKQSILNQNIAADLIDLRTISPWDRETVCASVRRTGRCLIVHEDNMTCGFGAEISAVIAEHELFSLHAPVMRLAVPDSPIPFSSLSKEGLIPSIETVSRKLNEIMSF